MFRFVQGFYVLGMYGTLIVLLLMLWHYFRLFGVCFRDVLGVMFAVFCFWLSWNFLGCPWSVGDLGGVCFRIVTHVE